jgi:hypothetical protein
VGTGTFLVEEPDSGKPDSSIFFCHAGIGGVNPGVERWVMELSEDDDDSLSVAADGTLRFVQEMLSVEGSLA